MNLAWMGRALCGAGTIMAMAFVVAGCSNDPPAASCDPECPLVGFACCGADSGPSCRNVVSDPDNCGGCGIWCASGSCRNGMCVPASTDDAGSMVRPDAGSPVGDCRPTCSSNQRCCGTTCVARGVGAGLDGRSDPSFSNCNTCGVACDPDRASACSIATGSSTPSCMCGAFSQCGVGQLCVSQGGSFTCVSTATDPMNCGTVGNACNAGESCVSGVCQCGISAACGTGQACCGSSGCVDTQTSAANCGGCGMVCGAGETCNAGACVCGSGAGARRCVAPMAGGPLPPPLGPAAVLGESCCEGACVANTDAACGACGSACTDGDTCQVSGGLPGAPAGAAQVCCGGPEVAFFGCGGGFPIP